MHGISSAGKTIAIDFGNNTTKIAVRTGESSPAIVPVPGLSREIASCIDPPDSIPVIPSLISYSPGGQVRTGSGALDPGMPGRSILIRWMAHYISVGSPARVRTGESLIRYQEAGEAFLSDVLQKVRDEHHITCPELVLTVPAGAYDHFSGWVSGFATRSGYSRIRLIEEPTAAAHLCCPGIRPGEPFLFLDFGADHLEVSVAALVSEGISERCRILGYAVEQMGGIQIDHWLCSEVLKKAGLENSPGHIADLLPACERAKENLSIAEKAAVQIPGKDTIIVTREDLELLLKERSFYPRISAAIDRALAGAFSLGYTESEIFLVIAAGGSSAIPSVKTLLCRRFGDEKVSTQSPITLIVMGAAFCEKRYPLDIRIRNEYAMRVWDARRAAFSFHTIVKKGSPYPSDGPVARFRIQGTYDGQTQFGIPVYEVPSGGGMRAGEKPRELVIHPSGVIRYADSPDPTGEEHHAVWLNEKKPTFIPADPPALQGEPRFELWFMIDATRQLLASARDLRTGKMAVEGVVIAQLS